MFDDEPIEVPPSLIDETGDANASRYCAPIYIAPLDVGLAIADKAALDFDFANEGSTRNATLTFIKYNKEYFAITCAHVSKALAEVNNLKISQEGASKIVSPTHGLYTPVASTSIHFPYKLANIRSDDLDENPDICIARVDLDYIGRVGCEPLTFPDHGFYPEFGIAYGYPEGARIATQSPIAGTLSTVGVACVAALEQKMDGNPRLNQEIADANGVNGLSGMSGGPILGVSANDFGIVGIVTKGYDIEPAPEGIFNSKTIFIEGQRITSSHFRKWLHYVPDLVMERDRSIMVHHPRSKL